MIITYLLFISILQYLYIPAESQLTQLKNNCTYTNNQITCNNVTNQFYISNNKLLSNNYYNQRNQTRKSIIDIYLYQNNKLTISETIGLKMNITPVIIGALISNWTQMNTGIFYIHFDGLSITLIHPSVNFALLEKSECLKNSDNKYFIDFSYSMIYSYKMFIYCYLEDSIKIINTKCNLVFNINYDKNLKSNLFSDLINHLFENNPTKILEQTKNNKKIINSTYTCNNNCYQNKYYSNNSIDHIHMYRYAKSAILLHQICYLDDQDKIDMCINLHKNNDITKKILPLIIKYKAIKADNECSIKCKDMRVYNTVVNTTTCKYYKNVNNMYIYYSSNKQVENITYNLQLNEMTYVITIELNKDENTLEYVKALQQIIINFFSDENENIIFQYNTDDKILKRGFYIVELNSVKFKYYYINDTHVYFYQIVVHNVNILKSYISFDNQITNCSNLFTSDIKKVNNKYLIPNNSNITCIDEYYNTKTCINVHYINPYKVLCPEININCNIKSNLLNVLNTMCYLTTLEMYKFYTKDKKQLYLYYDFFENEFFIRTEYNLTNNFIVDNNAFNYILTDDNIFKYNYYKLINFNSYSEIIQWYSANINLLATKLHNLKIIIK